MPRYYLHILTSDGWTYDRDGIERSTPEQVRGEAVTGIRDLLAADAKEGRMSLAGAVVVIAENGDELFRIPFSDAVSVDRP